MFYTVSDLHKHSKYPLLKMPHVIQTKMLLISFNCFLKWELTWVHKDTVVLNTELVLWVAVLFRFAVAQNCEKQMNQRVLLSRRAFILQVPFKSLPPSWRPTHTQEQQ